MIKYVLPLFLYLFYIFSAGWIDDWISKRSGVPQKELDEFVARQEKQEKEGKSKLEWFFSKPYPDYRALRRWSVEHASDPAMYKRCVWISRLADLPMTVFGIRVLLVDSWGIGPVPDGWFWGIAVYCVFLLLLGIRWRRKN